MKRIFSTTLGLLLAGAALAAPELSPQGIIVNPVPTDLQVRVWVNKDPGKTGNPVYQLGERIQVSVQVNQDAYVYIFSVKANGEIGLILPNAFDQNNLLRSGETRTYPPATGARYVLEVAGPEGQDRVLAVASRQPLSLAQIADIQTGRVNLQGADNLARALSIVVTPLPQQDWVSNIAFFTVARAAVTPVQPVQPGTGTLSVNSNPSGAQVLVEGRLVGSTPLNLVLRPGRVDLELRLGGYQTFRTSAQIRLGQTTVVNASLVPVVQNGLLQINSNPQGAQVLLDGRAVGNTPLNLTVQPGRYDLELRLGGYQTFRTSAQIRLGQTTVVNASLVPVVQNGLLQINSNPQGAQVLLDGWVVGNTPLNLTVQPGRYDLEVRLAGYQSFRVSLSVSSGQTVPVKATLQALRGTLEVYTNVEARIFLDGREVGQTRNGFLRLDELESGSVQVVALAPGYRVVFRDIRIEPGRAQQVRLDLMRAR